MIITIKDKIKYIFPYKWETIDVKNKTLTEIIPIQKIAADEDKTDVKALPDEITYSNESLTLPKDVAGW